MSRSFVYGPTGTIPDDEYLRKIQASRLQEDPELVEKYLRKQMVDFRPDAAFFESDQVRDPSDRGSGFGSRERLNLRHCGSRSEEDPYLPDGTFLDHEFMERDPRGTQNLPDFNAARKQREARGKFIKFYNDDDHSVPETGINPAQMVSLIRGTQQQFKDRFQNFEESMDSWGQSAGALRGEHSAVTMVTTDGTIVNLADATARQRQDPVNLLSNRNPAMLRWTSPDHRVKVSKYGMVRPIQSMNANDWNTNRNNSYLDHQIPIEINGQMVNRMLAHLILDFEGQRSTKQMVAQGTDYGDSGVALLRDARQKIDPDDLYKMIQIGMTSVSQSKTANTEFFEGKRMHRSINPASDIKTAMLAAEINHDIAVSMTQSNRALGPEQAKDLRELVKTSAINNGMYRENNNREIGVKRTTNTLKREGLDTRYIEEGRTTKNYGGIKPSANYNPHQSLEYEKFKKNSRENSNGFKNQSRSANRSKNDTQDEVDMSEFALPERRQTRSRSEYSGRSTIADVGDADRSDSTGTIDLHNTLYQMVLA